MKTKPQRMIVCLPLLPVALADGGAEPEWEICAPGKWRAMFGPVEIEPRHLAEMAANYDPNVEQAPVKFDHGWQGDAEGWISSLRIAGGKLLAKISNLSDGAAESIRSGKRRFVSSEIDFEHPVKKGWYLTGLALLGAANPAVKGLKPITLADSEPVYFPLSDAADGDAPAEGEPAAVAAAPTDEPEQLEKESVMDDKDKKAAATTTPAPTPTPDPQAAALAATQAQLAEVQKATAAQLEEGKKALAEAQRLNASNRAVAAQARVDATLLKLGNRIGRAALAGIKAVLLMFASAESPAKVQLAAADGTLSESNAYDTLEAALMAQPEIVPGGTLASAGQTADGAQFVDNRTPDEKQLHASAGLSDERVQELARKYGAN